MKASLSLIMIAAAILGVATTAQGGAQANGTIDSLPSGTIISAELSSSVDSKKTKAGDVVTAHITEAVKEDGKTVIPKGARLVGHITQATARAKGDAESTLAIQFEKAVIKNGQEIPLSVWIKAIAAEPRSVYQPGPEQNTMAGTPGAGQSPMGSGRSTMGGPPTATLPPVGPTGGGGGAASDADRTTGSPGGLNTSGQLTPNSRGVFGLDGVQLATDGSNASQGSLITSSGKTLHLDSGTRLLLAVLPDPTTAPNK